jgi:hypothetical protein
MMADDRKRTSLAGAAGGAAPTRRFPELERIFDGGERDVAMENIEKTCRALDEQTRTGAPRDRKRARAALNAYGRTLELIGELAELRERMAAGDSNK